MQKNTTLKIQTKYKITNKTKTCYVYICMCMCMFVYVMKEVSYIDDIRTSNQEVFQRFPIMYVHIL